MPRSRTPPPARLALVAALALAGCDAAGLGRGGAAADSASLAGALTERGVATSRGDAAPDPAARDWPGVRARDTLRVAAPYNSTTYFIYRGEPLGFEYELLKRFAADHGLALHLVVVQQRDSLLAMLRDGRVDVVAARLVPMPEDARRVAYTRALYHTNPVLVQRRGAPGAAAAALPAAVDTVLERGPAERAPAPSTIRARLVRRPAELAGRSVTLPEDSPYERTLLELADAISGDIHVVEVDASAEALMREVAKGRVAYTVTDGNLAKLQSAYFRNLVVRPVVGAERKVAWAVRPGARQLRDTLDAWIAAEQTGALLERLYQKYFVDANGFKTRIASRYLTSTTGRLSPYDSLLKAHAARLGWDWRLLGSQMYQESQFKPTARSWAGAQGLMQLMPATARQFGARDVRDPAQNVAAGVRFLEWLERHWADEIADRGERLKFILASYNAGAGHVEDARRLTGKHGDDPDRWDDVAYWLLQLSKAEHYDDPVVRYGFVRGLEPVTYVSLILARFEHYRQFVTPQVAAAR
jgi:membrane-bound lytic murein transglycosylase F